MFEKIKAALNWLSTIEKGQCSKCEKPLQNTDGYWGGSCPECPKLQ